MTTTVLANVVTIAMRPELVDAVDRLVASNLPPFMLWESPGNWRWHHIYAMHPEDQLVVLDDDGDVAAALNTVPARWDGAIEDLPSGFDDVVVAATDDMRSVTNATCLLSMSIRRDRRGRGLAEGMIDEVRRRARSVGRSTVIAPIRPTRKAAYPMVPIEHYVRWQREDGRPFDPWLRIHRACGGRHLGVAHRSLTIRQPVERWSDATGLRMKQPGSYVVDGALVPVEVADGIGVYAEPNLWVAYDV